MLTDYRYRFLGPRLELWYPRRGCGGYTERSRDVCNYHPPTLTTTTRHHTLPLLLRFLSRPWGNPGTLARHCYGQKLTNEPTTASPEQ